MGLGPTLATIPPVHQDAHRLSEPTKSKSVGARLAQRAADAMRLQRERYPRERGRFEFALPFTLSIQVLQMLMLTI